MTKNKFFLCFRPLVIETEDSQNNLKISTFKSSISRRRRRKSNSSRTFSRVLKSILFESSLKRRVRDRKEELTNEDSKSDGWRKIEEYSESVDSNAVSSSSISESKNYQSLSFFGSGSLSNSLYQKKQSISSSKGGVMYLILVSLCLTIFWGRACAILFTSMWLYFLPRCRRRGLGRGLGDTAANKKRVKWKDC